MLELLRISKFCLLIKASILEAGMYWLDYRTIVISKANDSIATCEKYGLIETQDFTFN